LHHLAVRPGAEGLRPALTAVLCALFPQLYATAEERKAFLLASMQPLLHGTSAAAGSAADPVFLTCARGAKGRGGAFSALRQGARRCFAGNSAADTREKDVSAPYSHSNRSLPSSRSGAPRRTSPD